MGIGISKVAIIGAGFTGKQIAAQTVLNGFNVSIFDIDSEILEVAKKYIYGLLKRKKRLDAIRNVTFHTDLNKALENVDLVIESVSENLDLKKEVFSQIDNLAPSRAIIGTNSSSFPVSKIESAVDRKDKVLNLHFYPPIPTHPMVDIMRGSMTSNKTFELGKQWIKSIECEPIVVKKESKGFVFNRMWHIARREALNMWDKGIADIETIDTAWKIFTGMKMGPFVLMDGIGLDTVYAVQMSYYEESGDPRDKPPDSLRNMVENGNLGMKTGKGFYTWKKKR